MLLQLIAPIVITDVKIACLATSLTFEFDCFVFYIETHIPAISSWIVMASLLRIKKSNKLGWRVGFARTFSITNFLLFSLRHLITIWWILWIIAKASLFWSLSTITCSMTPWAKMMSSWHNVVACFALWYFFCQTFCATCLFFNCCCVSIFVVGCGLMVGNHFSSSQIEITLDM